MKNWLSNLWSRIWRIGIKKFIQYHLYMILFMVIIWFVWTGVMYVLSVFNFFSCWDGICEWFKTIISYSKYIIICILALFYLLSNLLLAKRFQDCWICGIRALILWVLTILITILNVLFVDIDSILSSLPRVLEVLLAIFLSVLSLMPLLYLIVLIVMCLKKWDKSKNKYGNIV